MATDTDSPALKRKKRGDFTIPGAGRGYNPVVNVTLQDSGEVRIIQG